LEILITPSFSADFAVRWRMVVEVPMGDERAEERREN
jgi:hypothetical protein